VPAASPLITLLTDFGERDSFVASMKGVILWIHPDAAIIDLSHQIAPHRIDEAAYFIQSCCREFPDGTIHVVVVDPGVGSARRALAVHSKRQFFLAPDNGVLTSILNSDPQAEVREINQLKFRRLAPGHTFDGRDLFAPAAARLAKYEPFESYGRVIVDYKILPIAQPSLAQGTVVGEIVYVDRFGNLISNLTMAHLDEWRSVTAGRRPLIRIGLQEIDGLVQSYSEGTGDRLSALINSDGKLEVFLKEASAADRFQVSKGEKIEVL
jgi:S-adenosyl-L-methionine hydrolase (adenosine-forming)